MRHTKKAALEDIKSLLAIIIIVLTLTLSACSQKSSQNEVTVSGGTLSAPLPSALLTVDETNLVVAVVVDSDTPRTCANLIVDQGKGTYSCNITLPNGPHTLSLNFSIIDTNYGTVQVATTSSIEVDVVPGQTATADFNSATITYDDNDGDGINNLDELDEGSNPDVSSYYVGGRVTGLSGIGAFMQLNGANDLALSSDGNFNFIPAVNDKSTYTVTVLTQPSSPNQICTVSNESGTVSGENVTDVTVTCTTDQVAPSVVSTFDDTIIDVTTTFSLTFDETMEPQSLALSGDLGDDASASWSQGTVTDDTLNISPKVEWPIGTGQSLIIDANDLAGNSLASLTLVFDVSVIHVSIDATNASDSNVGTRDQPLQTIFAAVNRANTTLSKSEIRVALGTYTTFSEGGTKLEVSDGMRLMGSYSADWLLRNPITYPAIVNDTSTTTASDINNPNCVITISAGAGSETLVDGFTLTGGGVTDGSGNGASCGIEIEMNASPTIENNIISGGSAASSTGIIDRGLSPVIRNNTIRGSEPGAQSNGLAGISSNGSSPTIIGNDIIGGSGEAGRSGGSGISLTDVNAIVEQNMVVGANAEVSDGVFIGGTSIVLLRNNTIHGGNSYNTYGVSIGAGSTITLQNNTISSGNSAYGETLKIGSPAIIENNILLGGDSGVICINETNADADPIRLFANNLYGCEQRSYYYDNDAQCTSNADGDNDAHTCTLAEMNQLTDMQVDGSNISVDLGFGTQTDADWHLNAASPASVKFGGLDLSVDFSTDKDGTQRTAPWTIGAYEQD